MEKTTTFLLSLALMASIAGYFCYQSYNDTDRIAWSRLKVLEKAISLIMVDFESIQTQQDPAAISKILAQVTSDIDFVLAEIDEVRGSDLVKKHRKLLVLRLRPVTENVDRLIEKMASSTEGTAGP